MTKWLVFAGVWVGSSLAVLAMAAYEYWRLGRQPCDCDEQLAADLAAIDALEDAIGRAATLAESLAELGEPRLTVVWRGPGNWRNGMTGRVEWVDDDNLTIDDGHEFITIRRSDIVEMR